MKTKDEAVKLGRSGEYADAKVEKPQDTKFSDNTVKVVKLTSGDKTQEQEQSKSKEPQEKLTSKASSQSIRERITSLPSHYRARGRTISAFPVEKNDRYNTELKDPMTEKPASFNPYYVFLQLFYSPFLGGNSLEKPMLLHTGEVSLVV